jgi:hypothetical protein
MHPPDRRPIYNRAGFWPVLLLPMLLFSGCAHTLLGSDGVKAVNKLDKNVVGEAQNVLGEVHKTREEILDYLKFNSEKQAHDLSVGLLEGTIGYLDSEQNRKDLGQLLNTIIESSGSAARVELIKFKDELIDDYTVGQVQKLLRAVMQELIDNPSKNLLNLALGKTTRDNLQQMLYMIIPAILNKDAIGQIGSLRETLLGYDMKKDIASLVDTALIVADTNLSVRFRGTIKSIVDDNTSWIKKYGGWVIGALAGLVILVGGVVYFVQHKQAAMNLDMVRQVSTEIEELNRSNPAVYQELTNNIQSAMRSRGLEGRMNTFLKKEHIS